MTNSWAGLPCGFHGPVPVFQGEMSSDWHGK